MSLSRYQSEPFSLISSRLLKSASVCGQLAMTLPEIRSGENGKDMTVSIMMIIALALALAFFFSGASVKLGLELPATGLHMAFKK